MAKQLLLQAEIREQTGSHAVKRVLKQKKIPAVIQDMCNRINLNGSLIETLSPPQG